MGEIIPVDFGGNTERLDESSESSLVKNLDRLRSFVESALMNRESEDNPF